MPPMEWPALRYCGKYFPQVVRSEFLIIVRYLEYYWFFFSKWSWKNYSSMLSLISNLDRRHAELCVSRVALGCAENCESDYRCGFCCFSNVCIALTHCLIPMANIWMKRKIVSSNTYTLIQTHWLFQWDYWEVRVGRTKLMALTLPWQIKLQ